MGAVGGQSWCLDQTVVQTRDLPTNEKPLMQYKTEELKREVWGEGRGAETLDQTTNIVFDGRTNNVPSLWVFDYNSDDCDSRGILKVAKVQFFSFYQNKFTHGPNRNSSFLSLNIRFHNHHSLHQNGRQQCWRLHYITLHYITLHYITLHYITVTVSEWSYHGRTPSSPPDSHCGLWCQSCKVCSAGAAYPDFYLY